MKKSFINKKNQAIIIRIFRNYRILMHFKNMKLCKEFHRTCPVSDSMSLEECFLMSSCSECLDRHNEKSQEQNENEGDVIG